MKKHIALFSIICSFFLACHACEDSRHFGPLPKTFSADSTNHTFLALMAFASSSPCWPGGDAAYPSNRLIAARALYERFPQTFKDEVLGIAALHNDHYLVEHALECGANPNADDFGTPVIFKAKSREVAELLVAKGALLTARAGLDWNLLHSATHTTHSPKLLEYYIQSKKIPINQLNFAKQTPLHTLAEGIYHLSFDDQSDSAKKLQLLLDENVDCAQKDMKGKTAIDIFNKNPARRNPENSALFNAFEAPILKKMQEQETAKAAALNPSQISQDLV